jgi:tetratricopeptide (TPR) repeat protein
MTRLYDKHYENCERRDEIKDKITRSWSKMPVFVRIELLADLAESALGHEDPNNALELVNEADELLRQAEWLPEHRIERTCGLIELRFRAGDSKKALAEAEAMRKLYEEKEKRIVNIYRAEALRHLGEAYQSMGQTETAISIYKKAVEAGVVNPNSRPRAEDLSATCCSMAVNEVKPDEELWKRIYQIKEELGQPW